MPEHRAGTPAAYRTLESFLWHDLDGGPDAWSAWLAHRGIAADAAASFEAARDLHAALRTLEMVNAALSAEAGDAAAAREALNRLVAAFGLRPDVDADGGVGLVAADAADPAAALLGEALAAMQAGVWRRFKLCREPSCRASYFDASKAAAKLWCEMTTCGSRNKMRRYRARG